MVFPWLTEQDSLAVCVYWHVCCVIMHLFVAAKWVTLSVSFLNVARNVTYFRFLPQLLNWNGFYHNLLVWLVPLQLLSCLGLDSHGCTNQRGESALPPARLWHPYSLCFLLSPYFSLQAPGMTQDLSGSFKPSLWSWSLPSCLLALDVAALLFLTVQLTWTGIKGRKRGWEICWLCWYHSFFILAFYDLATLVVVTLVEVEQISVHLSSVSYALLVGALCTWDSPQKLRWPLFTFAGDS